MSDYSLPLRSDYKIACWLMLVLASFYLFFFSGRFHSLDEIHSVAVTETFLMEGTFHTNQIDLLDTLPISQTISIQDWTWSVLLAPLQQLAYWLARLNWLPSLPDVGVVGMVMLSNWWITTITGGLLYLLVRRLGYQPATGVVVTLAWGAGTLAPVYSKLLYMQPVIALGLLALMHFGTTKVVTTGVIIGLTVANFLLTNAGIRDWVPLLPLWCLGLAPCWESRRGRWLLVFVLFLSVLIQLPNMLIDFNSSVIQASNEDAPFVHQLWRLTDEVYSLDYFLLLANRQAWDIAWVRTGSWYVGLAIFLLCLAALYGLYEALQAKNTLSIRVLSASLLILVGFTQVTAYHDPKWSAYHADLLPLVKHLNVAPENSVLLFEMHGYHDYIDRVQAWFNLNHSRVPQIQFLQQNELDERQIDLLQNTTQQAQWIYLATEGTAPGNPISGTERWFGQHAFLTRDEWVGPYTRLTVFHSALTASLPPVVSAPLPLADGITLLEANTSMPSGQPFVMLEPGDPLLISLTWQANQVPEADYTIFVQLLGPTGVVAEQEGWPQANFAPTSSWQAGDIVVDRRALIVPDLPAGNYSLIAGMFNSKTGQRLTVGDNEGHTISLGVVRVN